MIYRPEIDGLRFVAVSSVVLFHAGLNAIPGGFVGVDIFFVISGFLISRIVMEAIRKGEFSLLVFYERRARRILPALLLMLTFVFLVASFVLLPSQRLGLPYEAMATIFFASNIYYWTQSGYFAPEASEQTLMHTWSLGIEEQFYIFAPVLLVFLARRFPKHLGWCVLAIVGASFAASVVLSPGRESSSFFLLHTRAWELGVGSLLGTGFIRSVKSARAKEFWAFLGMILILGSLFYIDDNMPFPGSVAALPVAGTALILASAQGTFTARLLSLKPFVAIGLISYSLYLWHWPLLVLGEQTGLVNGSLSRAIAVCFAVVAAFLSWRFVETPSRDRRLIPLRKFSVSVGLATTCLFAGFVSLSMIKGWPLSQQAYAFDMARFDFSPERGRCHHLMGTPARDFRDSCVLGGEHARTVIWSDSHGVELAFALSEHIPIIAVTRSSCAPAPGMTVRSRPLCDEHNVKTLDHIVRSGNIDTVVMVAYYKNWIGNTKFRSGFSDSVRAIRNSGKRVMIVGPMPAPGPNVPTLLAKGAEMTFPRSIYEATNAKVLPWLTEVAAGDIFYPADTFCNMVSCSLVDESEGPLLFDKHHASMAGARLVAYEMADALVEVKRPFYP